MNPTSINSQSVAEAMPRELGERLAALRIMPTELLGKIPETVWQTLNIDQRAEILRQYGILEKYVRVNENQLNAVVAQAENSAQVAGPVSTEISLDQLASVNTQPVAPQQMATAQAVTPAIEQISHESTQQYQQSDFQAEVDRKNQIELQNSVEQAAVNPASTEVESYQVESQVEAAPVEQNSGPTTIDITPNKEHLSKEMVKVEQATEKVIPKFFGYSVSDDTARSAKELAESGDTREGKVWAAALIQKIWDAIFN